MRSHADPMECCLTGGPAPRLLGRGGADLGAHDEVVGPKGVVVLCHVPDPLHRPSHSSAYQACMPLGKA